MKPTLIKISAEFHVLGNGVWLGAEIPVASNEDPIAEFVKGRDMLVNAFKAMNPEVQLSVPVKQVDKPPTGDVIKDIASCKEIKVLKTYQLLVKGNNKWQEAYDKKMTELKSPPKRNGKIALP